MKRLLALLACVMMGCEPVAVVVDYDYSEVYTSTVTRAVGATTLAGTVRDTLPQPAPTDLNTIFVAPNGDDGDAGTEAAPKLTLNGANAALGGALTTIQIIRNGYVGDLVIHTTGNMTLAGHLQTELGEIGYLSGSNTTIITIAAARNINGIAFLDAVEPASARQIRFSVTTTSAFSVTASTFQYGKSSGAASYLFSQTVASNISFNYCAFWIQAVSSSPGSVINGENLTLAGVSFNNCLGVLGQTTGNVIPRLSSMAFNYHASTNLGRPTFSRCAVFGGCFYEFDNLGGSTDVTLTIDNCAAITLAYASNTQSTGAVTITANTSYTASQEIAFTSSSFALGIASLINNSPVATGLPPLFTGQAALQTRFDPSDARLQIAGKTTPDGTGIYFITSPLRAAGLAGVDVNPWDETISGPVRTYNKQMTLHTYPQALQVPDELTGAVEVANLNGGSERDYDGVQQKWMLNWDKDSCPTQIVVKQLKALQRDRGTQKWYLGDLAGDFGFSDIASSGTVASIDSTRFTVTLITPAVDLVENNWANKWMVFDMGSAPAEEFWIESNDNADELILVDKLGNGIPANGDYDITVPYLLGNLSLDSITALQQRLQVDMRKGSTYAEVESAPDTHPWTGGNVILIEQTDPKPNL